MGSAPGGTPSDTPDPAALKDFAARTRRLVHKAEAEGNHALARELERIAIETERKLAQAA